MGHQRNSYSQPPQLTGVGLSLSIKETRPTASTVGWWPPDRSHPSNRPCWCRYARRSMWCRILSDVGGQGTAPIGAAILPAQAMDMTRLGSGTSPRFQENPIGIHLPKYDFRAWPPRNI